MRFWITLVGLLLGGVGMLHAAQITDWGAAVRAAYEGYKAHYITCGDPCADNPGLVLDPDRNYESVSEGIGYGMLMAVMMDDQPTFDAIYDASQSLMTNESTSLHHWQVTQGGEITGYASATDAEQDIALALIFAEKRVERGQWRQHAQFPYGPRARTMLSAIYTFMVEDGRHLSPSDGWAVPAQQMTNPSYFSPAWYRIYADFEQNPRWGELYSHGYRVLYATEGAPRGLAPDWTNADGQPVYELCEQIERTRDMCRYEMSFDGIRVPWRVGLDCLWYGEERACEWSRRGAAFLNSLPADDPYARMYDLQGNAIIDYHNEVTASMWLVAALAAGDEALQQRLLDQLQVHSTNLLTEGHWGDTTRYYYNQSLAWLGLATYTGDFRNLYTEE